MKQSQPTHYAICFRNGSRMHVPCGKLTLIREAGDTDLCAAVERGETVVWADTVTAIRPIYPEAEDDD